MLEVLARWDWDPEAKTLLLDIEQEQPGPPFEMPVEVGLDVAGEHALRLVRIDLSSKRQSFTLPLDAAPRSVVLDPRTWVLMDARVSGPDRPGSASRSE